VVLGIDIGGSYCKAVLIDQNNEVMCSERAAMPGFVCKSEDNGFVCEVRVDRILSVVIDVLKRMRLGGRRDIQGIGVAGQMHGILVVDVSNEPVSNFISWQDRRTAQLIPGEDVSYVEFLKIHLSELRNQSGTDIRPGMLGPVVFWLKKNDFPFPSKSKVAFLSDFVVSYLTGAGILCDRTQAAGSGVYSLSDDCWAKAYLAATKISESILPDVVETGTKCGHISGRVAQLVGIKQGVPVYTSVGDYQAALLASGIDGGSVSVNVGTGGQVSVLNRKVEYSDKFETRPFFDGFYLNCISGLPAGRTIKLYEAFVDETVRLFSGRACECNVLEKLDSRCEKGFVKNDVVCDPDFFGHGHGPSKGGFFNIDSQNLSITSLYKALLEGIVGAYAEAFGRIKNAGDRRVIKRTILSGGVGRKSKVFQKLVEKQFGYRVEIPPYEEEAAVGAALIARKGNA